MSEFEDPQLERQLGQLSGPFPDDNAAYARVQQRVRQVKRRRAVAVSGMAAVLVFAGVAFAAGRGDSSRTLTPGRPDVSGVDDSASDSTDDAPETSTDDSTATSTATRDSTVTTESSAPGQIGTSSTAGSGTTPPSATNPQGSTPGSTPGSQPATTPPTSPATTAPPPPATTAPAGPVTRTYAGIGGSITVRLASGSLTLLDSTANPGFSENVILSAGDRVEVRFESAAHKTKVRVDVVGDAMQPYIEEQAT